MPQKDALYLVDGTPVPFLVCDAEDIDGYPPIFLESSRDDFFLTMGEDVGEYLNPIKDDLFKTHGPVSQEDQKRIDYLKNHFRYRINSYKSNISFETPLDLHGNGRDGPEKNLLRLQEKIDEVNLDRYPLPWSLYTRDNQYVFGWDMNNFLEAKSTMEKEAYEFSIALEGSTMIVKIAGRNRGGRLDIDRSCGKSLVLGNGPYSEIFDKGQIGNTFLSHFSYVWSRPDEKISIPVDYVAGMWKESSLGSPLEGFVAQGQPNIGIFSVRENENPSLSQLDRVIPEFKLPRIKYEGKSIIPINYGGGSAVAFIDKNNYMTINGAHVMMDYLYSISARDAERKSAKTNDKVSLI